MFVLSEVLVPALSALVAVLSFDGVGPNGGTPARTRYLVRNTLVNRKGGVFVRDLLAL